MLSAIDFNWSSATDF